MLPLCALLPLLVAILPAADADGETASGGNAAAAGPTVAVRNDVGKVVVYGPPLEAKPIIPLDNASPPPVIVLDVFRAVICSDGVAKGVARALALVVARLVRGAMSYVPLVGRFFL